MHYSIIVWSHRPDSQSTKIAHYIQSFLENIPNIIDLKNNPLPLRNDYMRDDTSDEYQQTMKIRWPIQSQLQQTDALIIISPERSGMVPAWLKNFFLYCSAKELANKPALAIGISSGPNGAYPIAELKMSSNKNAQFFYIPQHIIIRNVEKVFNPNTAPPPSPVPSLSAGKGRDGGDNLSSHEQRLHDRIVYSLQMLHQYALAMQYVRNSWISDTTTYPYGM